MDCNKVRSIATTIFENILIYAILLPNLHLQSKIINAVVLISYVFRHFCVFVLHHQSLLSIFFMKHDQYKDCLTLTISFYYEHIQNSFLIHDPNFRHKLIKVYIHDIIMIYTYYFTLTFTVKSRQSNKSSQPCLNQLVKKLFKFRFS